MKITISELRKIIKSVIKEEAGSSKNYYKTYDTWMQKLTPDQKDIARALYNKTVGREITKEKFNTSVKKWKDDWGI